jgi:hypothetical protein
MSCQRIIFPPHQLRSACVFKNGSKVGCAVNASGRFLLVVGLICGGAYFFAYLLAISPIYCAYSQSYVDEAPCYKYDLHGIKADVLLVGDSSLLYGIRPSLVEKESLISTYNYGMVGPAFSFDPQAVIDHYLATNTRPQAVIVYFSPWDRLERHKLTDPQWFPLAVLTLRHGTWVDFLRLFYARPSAIFEIPPTILRSVGLSPAPAARRRAQTESDYGHFDYAATIDSKRAKLTDDCHPVDRDVEGQKYGADNRAALTSLRAQYAAIGLPLYVFVAPTAACDGQIDQVRAAYDGVSDNLPAALPNQYFPDDTGRRSHVNAAGVVVASALLADFLVSLPLKAKKENLRR